MPDDSAPVPADVVEMAHHYFTNHSEAHIEMSRMLDLVNRKFAVFEDLDTDKWTPVRTGTAGSMIHRFAHQIVTDEPIVTYAPRSNTRAGQEDADLAELWGQNLVQRLSDSNIESPLITAAKWSLLGGWVLKGPLFDVEAWPEMPPASDKEATRLFHIQQADRTPFMIEAIDPRQVVWDDDNPQNPYWTIRRRKVQVWQATRKIPKGIFSNSNNRKSSDFVEMTEYVDKDWRLVMLDGEPVSWRREDTGELVAGPQPNVYGYNYYMPGFSPWSMATGTSAQQMRSMLYFIEDELVEESRVATIKRIASQLYGLAPMVAADPEKFAAEMAGGLGSVVSADDPKDVGKSAPRPMEMPTPPAWFERYEASITERMGSNTATSSLLGERQTGTTSALMEGVLMGEGRLQFQPITKQLQRQMAKILNRCAWISEEMIQEPQSIWNERSRGRDLTVIKPNLWRNAYHYSVSLEPVDPTRDDRRAMLGLNLFAQGLISPVTALEDYLRIPAANEELKRIMLWRTLQSPEFQQLITQQAMQENEVEDAIESLVGGSPGPTPGNSGDFAAFDQALSAGIPENNAEPGFAGGGRGSLDPSGGGSTGIGQLAGRGRADVTGGVR